MEAAPDRKLQPTSLVFVLFPRTKRIMELMLIVLTAACGMMSFAIGAGPIGNSADFGNGAAINRGPAPPAGGMIAKIGVNDFSTRRSRR